MTIRAWIYIGVLALFLATLIVPILSDAGFYVPGWIKLIVVLAFVADVIGNIVSRIEAISKKRSDQQHTPSESPHPSANAAREPNPPNNAPEPTP